MNNGIRFLKVKVKTLAAEAKFIRIEHQRAKTGELKQSLHDHKLLFVRPEARATYVAYGLLRGRAMEAIEPGAKSQPDWKRIHSMIRKYGTSEDLVKLAELKQAA